MFITVSWGFTRADKQAHTGAHKATDEWRLPITAWSIEKEYGNWDAFAEQMPYGKEERRFYLSLIFQRV